MKKILNLLLPSLLFLGTATRAQFIENKGQVLDMDQNFRPEVQFYYTGPDVSIYFLKDRVVYAFRENDKFDFTPYANNARAADSIKATLGYTQYRLDMEFVGANPGLTIEKGEKAPGDLHFYLNKRNGIRDVGAFKSIRYKNVYNRVDVVFYELSTGLKYDIVLHEGARIEDVRILYNGAENIRLENKKAIIKTKYKTLEEAIPLAYVDGDKSKETEITYRLDEKGVLSFQKPQIRFQTLTIDPVLEWATYFNGSAAVSGSLSYDQNHLDAQGNFYIYGIASNSANNYPVIGPGGSAYTSAHNLNNDIYLAKFNSNRALVWGTYLGGSGSEYTYGASSLASRGNVLHIVGEAMSNGAPFTNGGGFYQATQDYNFWARFDISTGQLQHLTTLGGGYKPSIAVSNSGQVAIIRHAYSFNNPVVMNRAGAFNQATNGGFTDMFLMLFNASYAQIWGTYLGGPGTQEAFSCAFDNNDNLFFVGENNWSGSSSNAASERLVNLPGAYYQGSIAGATDVTLGKFNAAGALVWHTLFGGNNNDARQGQQGGFAQILVHPATQELVLMFNTMSVNLNTISIPGAYFKTVPTHASYGGSSGSFWNYAAYIAKFSTAGALNYGTYWYNTTDGDLIFDASFGGCDKLYIAGRVDYNTAVTQPLTGGFNLPNGQQTFLMQMNSNTYASEWTSFLANNTSMQPSVTGQTNTPRVYLSANGYYDNGPTVDPGNGAYYQAHNINQPPGNPTAFAYNYMLWQLHPSLPPQVTGDLDLCSGETTILTASGGTGTPYNWYTSNTSTPAFHTGNTYTTPALSGNTTYYVSSGSGMCESSRTPVTVVVTSGGGTPFAVTGGGTICTGGSPLNIGLNGSQAGISYQLYNNGTPEGVPVNGTGSAISFGSFSNAGTYTVVAGGSGGSCSTNMTGNAVINVLPTPATPGFTTNSPLCAGSVLQLNGPTLAGTDYFWSGPNGFSSSVEDPQIASVTAAASGTYSLYVVSGSCTSATATQTVTVNPVPAAPGFTVNSPVCEGAALNFNGPAVSGATYTWAGPGGFTSAVQNPVITGATAARSGTYSLVVTVNGCTSAVATQNVTVNPAPVIALGTVTQPSGCGASNGSIQVTGTGSGSLGWTGSATGAAPSVTLPHSIPNLGAGSYSIAYVSAAGCTSNVLNQTLVNPAVPATPAFTANTPLCAGASLNLDADPVTNATYVWSGPNGFSSSVEDPQIASVTASASGTYSLYVVVNGCTSATATQTVTVNAVPATPAFTVNSPVCEGTTLNFNGPAVTGATYAWTGPGGFTSAVQSPGITGSTAAHSGSYSLTVTVNGCTSAATTQTVTVNPLPVIAAGTVSNPTGCGQATGSIQITGTATGNIGWTGGATGFQPGVTLPYTINNLPAGNYSIGFLSAAGCSSNVVVSVLTDPAAPAAPAFTSNSPLCAGASLQLTATPVTGATYVWAGPNGFSAGTANPAINPATAAASGNYSLYVVVNNCTSATTTQPVTVNPIPATPTFGSNAPICSGNTLSLDGPSIAGATYAWTGPNGFSAGTEDATIPSATSAATGSYSLTVTVNGCTSAAATQTLTVYDVPPAPTIAGNNPICTGADLSMTADLAGATGYQWSGPGGLSSAGQTLLINGVNAGHAGIYSVYAVLGSCTSATATVQVNVLPGPAVTYTGPAQNCGKQVTLTAEAVPAAGTVFTWTVPGASDSGASFTHTYTGNLPHTLAGQVKATGPNGCADSIPFTLQLIDPPVADFSAEDLCNGSSVAFTETHGGNGTPAFAWSFGGTGSTLPDPTHVFGAPGTYPVSLTVSFTGTPCKDTVLKNIVILPAVQPQIGAETKCLQEILFSGSAEPDTGLTKWEWLFGDGETASGYHASHTYKNPGTYTVTWQVETANGCTFTQTQTVTVELSSESIPEKLPNVFTPNGDAANNEINFDDILGECGEYEAIFFNRWGSPVFTQKNGTAPFVGKTQQGTALSEGVYYYVLKYGDSQKGGHITLSR